MSTLNEKIRKKILSCSFNHYKRKSKGERSERRAGAGVRASKR